MNKDKLRKLVNKMDHPIDRQKPQADWQERQSINKNLTTNELFELRRNTNYQECRSFIKIIQILQWIIVAILFLVGLVIIGNSNRTIEQEIGLLIMAASIILGVFNPYLSNLWHLPFDAVDLLFEIKRNRK